MTIAEREKRWSPRSVSNIREERGLQRELERFQELKRKAKEALVSLAREKQRALEAVKAGEVFGDQLLGETLLKIEDQERKRVAFTESVSEAESRIEEFRQATSARAADRLKAQNELARLVAERLKKDEALEKRLQEMRQLLQERAELTSRLEGLGESIELACSFGGGNAASLLAHLPQQILPESRAWASWLLGGTEGLTPYVVCDKQLAVPETLARSQLYHFGETVYLAEDEARELLREDRPPPQPRVPWDYLAPSIMSVGAFNPNSQIGEGCSVEIR